MQSYPVTTPDLSLYEKLCPLGAVKEFIKVQWDHEDAWLRSVVVSAIDLCATKARISVLPHEREIEGRLPKGVTDEFGLFPGIKDPDKLGKYLYLRDGPVRSITSVSFVTRDETTTSVIQPSEYELNRPLWRLVWKARAKERMSEFGTVRVRYAVGFSIPNKEVSANLLTDNSLTADEKADLVSLLKFQNAIFQTVASWYENRGNDIENVIPGSVQPLLHTFFRSPLLKSAGNA